MPAMQKVPRVLSANKNIQPQNCMGTEIKRLVLSDEGEIYRILNICLLLIFFLHYAINEENTNSIFFMQSGLVNEKCSCSGVILTLYSNTSKRLHIFYTVHVFFSQMCFLTIVYMCAAM